jgi:salicylate hydroxylase
MSKIIIIGGGIAGPILATFLKLKGYEPVIYERLDGVVDAGVSLMSVLSCLNFFFLFWICWNTDRIQPNGMRILAQIPGFMERLPNGKVDNFRMVSISEDGEREVEELVNLDVGEAAGPTTRLSMKPVTRTEFHKFVNSLSALS